MMYINIYTIDYIYLENKRYRKRVIKIERERERFCIVGFGKSSFEILS